MKQKETSLDIATKYYDEFLEWLNVLKPYHTNRFDRNYRQYTAYATTEGTESKVSDPVASEIIERVIQRIFERDPKFNVEAKGNNIPKEIKDILTGAVEYMWNSPEATQASGTMRSRLKVIGREFCITGNVVVETYFNSESNLPDVQIIPIEDVVFDPAKSLKTSKVLYVRKFVSLDYLKDNEEIVDKNGQKKGLFTNLDKVLKLLADHTKKTNDTTDNRINRSGSDNYTPKTDEIQMITRYEGAKTCRFIVGFENEAVTVQEFYNDVLEDDPLDVAMDIEVAKEPYAFGLLDFLNGLTKLKDLFINQLTDYGSKVLNPPLFVDPSLAPINRSTLRNAWKLGGLVFAPPQQAEHKPMPALGSFGFEMLAYLQQRSEGVSGVGAYLGGVPNQTSDKTQGTKGGIQALMSQAITPVKDRQQNLEESIVMPMINKWLKIKGALMSPNEIQDIITNGASPKWIKLTKGILTGKMTIYDMLTAGLLTEEELIEMEKVMLDQGILPDEEIVVDTDWIVSVETGSMAEVDKAQDLENFDGWIQFNQQLGVPVDAEKVSIERAMKAGIKDPEQYIQKINPMANVQIGMNQPANPMGQPMPVGM
jgi:hypothetical protein